jgi:hypothetical protein
MASGFVFLFTYTDTEDLGHLCPDPGPTFLIIQIRIPDVTFQQTTRPSRESHSQIRRVFYLTLFCVNQWEEAKYVILFRYWLKSEGTLPMSF